MSKIEYSIDELHNLVHLGLRSNLLTSSYKDRWLPNVAADIIHDLKINGNPLKNSFYKNMKLKTLTDHMNVASSTKNRGHIHEHDDSEITIDDGVACTLDRVSYKFKLVEPMQRYNKVKNYEPYFQPTNRISDLCLLNSTGPIQLKVSKDTKLSTTISYVDNYGDTDVSCVLLIVDIGKHSKVDLDEMFVNKDGQKLYNILYLVRDGAELNLTRNFDITNKDNAMNVVESKVIQFPNSSFKYTVTGEGSKHTQDILNVDVHEYCNTEIKGSFYCYENFVNNSVANIHHIGKNSKSRVDIKSIIDDNAHSSFLGCITVDKDATGVDAELYNKNLCVSDNATVITEPQLDINTKDIMCKHGCTISNISKEQLYYLNSRGIENYKSEDILQHCFLAN